MLRIFFSRPLDESETADWTTGEERSRARTFGSERRRREWLTWRTLVRRELGRSVRIAYDGAGAPVLPDGEASLSVAHCEGSVVVCLADRRCAVDVEVLARDFSRAAMRCMTPGERMLADDPHWPALVWCAKETLYKYAGRRELDLLGDLRIERVDPAADFRSGTLVGRIGGGEALTLRFLLLDTLVIVFLS